MVNIHEIWSLAKTDLKNIINQDDIFNSYIAVSEPVSLEGNDLTLGVNGEQFLVEWIDRNYKTIINNAINKISAIKYTVKFVINPNYNKTLNSEVRDNEYEITPDYKVNDKQKKQGVCYGVLNPDFTFDDFVVGPANDFTCAAARAVVDKPGEAYNPLFIYGDTGLGKTHVMQAVGHEILNTGKNVAYTTTETLLNEYSAALTANKVLEFRDKYRRVDLLMIDDIQFFAGKPGLQEEFFHTFNALYQDHKQIILTSDRPPAEVSGLEKRLVSRFNQGLSVQMETPNFEMRLAILRYKQFNMTIKLNDAEEFFIAQNVQSNVRLLEGAMNRVLAYKKINKAVEISTDQLRSLLQDLIEEEKQHILSEEQIREVVAEYFTITVDDLNSESRHQSLVIPRQIAMFLCRVLTQSSLPSIARTFNKTHANILHACKKVKKQYQEDKDIHDKIIFLLQKLGKTPSDLNNI